MNTFSKILLSGTWRPVPKIRSAAGSIGIALSNYRQLSERIVRLTVSIHTYQGPLQGSGRFRACYEPGINILYTPFFQRVLQFDARMKCAYANKSETDTKRITTPSPQTFMA
jgi:hypothetical protein